MNRFLSFCACVLAVALTASAQDRASAPGHSARPADCGPAGTVSYDDYDATVQRLRMLYRSQFYGELDAALACLVKDQRTFRSGRPGSGAAYWLFRREFPAPGVASAEAAQAVHAWRVQVPSPMLAEFAALRLMYASAWNARGTSPAVDVSPQGMQAFAQGLAQTEDALLRASKELRDTPLWHNLLLATVLDSPQPRSDPDAVLSAALARWPGYYDFYEVALSRKVPRWGGSWAAVDRFIRERSAARKAAEGDSLYARLYWNVIASGASPRETLISWPRMKASLDELVERYPDPAHKNVAASFGCAFGDPDYARKSRSRMAPGELRASAWLRGTDPGSCPG